jgi:hypothetical protein
MQLVADGHLSIESLDIHWQKFSADAKNCSQWKLDKADGTGDSNDYRYCYRVTSVDIVSISSLGPVRYFKVF